MPSRNQSLWLATSPATGWPALSGRVEVDVAIVGAGITGVTAATLLVEAGYRVALVDLDRVGGGETCHTTAHLTDAIDSRMTPSGATSGGRGPGLRLTQAVPRSREAQHGPSKVTPDAGFSRRDGYLFTGIRQTSRQGGGDA